MEEIKQSKEELTGESVYSDNDLSSQMRDKIRSQAQRLRGLEQYRILCEQRILELFPNHPVPIKQEHLGLNFPTSNELLQAKQKIAKLESQIAQKTLGNEELQGSNEFSKLLDQYNQLVKDKNDLEESLRSEMLTCEEQRTYIEVLKQAIESKLEEFPKTEGYKPEKENPKANEAKREQAKIKNTMLDYESQIKRFQSQLKNKEIEIESLRKEKQELNAHLHQAAEALQIAEEEVDKLEEEKTNLLEYVDEHSSKEQEMEKELNDLSKYFEEMKGDFDITKEQLEQERNYRAKFEIENEVLNEEIFKNNSMIKELQNTLNMIKGSTDEKEGFLRKLKEDKLNFEIKCESLQANASTLAETLKETQIEIEELQSELENYRKADSHKSENIQKMKNENSNFLLELTQTKESLAETQKELESERKEKLELERMRELDIKQIQEFKLKLTQLKAKCDNLEEDKKYNTELENYRKLDNQKFNQLQEEFNYLQDSYRETQQRELIQSEALNELRKHNSEINRELEDLYRENQEISLELTKKNQEFELYYSKFSHLNELCETLESEKNRIENQLKGEKNGNKSLKEQSHNDKLKIEDLKKLLQESNEKLEKVTKRLKAKEDEAQHLRSQLKSRERDIEDEKYSKLKISEENKEIIYKLESREKDIEKSQTDIVECCKLIANFAGKYSISTSDYRSYLSSAYKEFLCLWKEKINFSPKILHSWINYTVEEIEYLTKTIFDLNKDMHNNSLELTKIASKLDGASSGEMSFKQEVTKLRVSLEKQCKKHENYVETAEREINSLRLEINSLKSEIGGLINENNSIKDSLQKYLSENHDLKLNTEMIRSSLRTHEDRVNLLKTEKNQLESLLSQVQRSLGFSEINKIYNEISRIRGELELLERERLNLECQLLKFETDTKAKNSENFKELSQKLIQCERKIRNYKKSMQILQEDANKEEMVQKLRGNDRETTKKIIVSNANNPQTVNLLNPRYSESPQSLRQRSPFS